MLKKLAKRINKEPNQARDYCEQSALIKTASPQTSELFATLSAEEITHAEKLLREGNGLIESKITHLYDEGKSTSDEAWHEKCKVIWEWGTQLANEEILDIKYKLSKIRGA